MSDTAPVATRPITIAALKRRIRPGDTFDVTNHYIENPDHPAFGTTRRTVLAANGSSFTLSIAGPQSERGSRIDWPHAGQAFEGEDGRLLLYGGGRGQRFDALYLTLVPAPEPGGDTAPPE